MIVILILDVQIPLLGIAGTLIYFKVRYTIPQSGIQSPQSQTASEKLARIDFLGCFLLAGFVGALLIAVSLKTSAVGENEIGWSDPWVVGLFVTSGILFLVFVGVETKVAKEPVLPLELLHRRTAVSVAVHNLVMSIMLYAVVSPSRTITSLPIFLVHPVSSSWLCGFVNTDYMQFYSVPMFYTAVNLMSASNAGNHMIPNAFFAAGASLGSGFLVRMTGKYYWITVLSGLSGVVSTVMLSFWTRDTPEYVLLSHFLDISPALCLVRLR